MAGESNPQPREEHRYSKPVEANRPSSHPYTRVESNHRQLRVKQTFYHWTTGASRSWVSNPLSPLYKRGASAVKLDRPGRRVITQWSILRGYRFIPCMSQSVGLID